MKDILLASLAAFTLAAFGGSDPTVVEDVADREDVAGETLGAVAVTYNVDGFIVTELDSFVAQ